MGASHARASAARAGSYRYYALAILTLVYMLNLVDRALVMLLLQPIKEDLSLSDTQLGFITGIAFGLFYATVGLPIARWSDRGDRATITAIAVGLWGLTVMASLFIASYAQLVAARVAAAIGEAGCKPPTYAMVGDFFPASAERTRAMSVYLTGAPLAALLAFVVGGWLNELYGWRLTFFIMGVPGLLLAALVKLTVTDPRPPFAASERAALPSSLVVLKVLWHRRSCRHLAMALILLYTMGLGLGPWYAAFMIRSHGMNTQELGLWLGLIFGLCGIAGLLAGGYVVSRWFGESENSQLRITALSVAALVPCFVAFLTVPSGGQALVALVPLMLVFNFFLPPTYALLQRIVTDDMRATAMALVMLLSNLIGMGLGPLIVGSLSDLLEPRFGTDSLRLAMLAMSCIALWAAAHFRCAGRWVLRDLETLEHARRSPVSACLAAQPQG